MAELKTVIFMLIGGEGPPRRTVLVLLDGWRTHYWALFEYDESVPERRAALCPPNREFSNPGMYILSDQVLCNDFATK
jgi:hypothetical protein